MSRWAVAGLWVGVSMLGVATPLCAQSSAQPPVQPVQTTQVRHPYPHLSTLQETAFLGAGAVALTAGSLIDVDLRVVPSQGLDPGEIAWSVDRNIVGNISLDADDLSDWTRTVAIAYPLVLGWITETPGQRWRGFGRRSVVYAETFLVSQGVTAVAKTTIGRARPYAYLPEEQRPSTRTYDVDETRTFYSMPSGHASSSWTAASLAMTEHLLTRPEAVWWERFGVGFVGGVLAGGTSALRVEAGQHFPSDVLLGSTIGIASGVFVPLLHRGDTPLPAAHDWLQMAGGAVAGTLVGFLVAQSY